MGSFDRVLSVGVEDIEFHLRFAGAIPWTEFLLNPRRLQGSDFLMRWSQGVWSERRLKGAVNATGRYIAVPYGPSGTAPDTPREAEKYFDRLDKAGIASTKRPDLLIVQSRDGRQVEDIVASLGGTSELTFTDERDDRMRRLVSMSVVAVECENSLWRAKRMPDYGKPLRPMRRLRGLDGLPKGAVVPTVIVKEEDRQRLLDWHTANGVPIHIWHVFYDLAFGIPLDRAVELIQGGRVEMTEQTFQAPGGPTTKKGIYKIYYHHAYPLGEATEEPELKAESIVDKNGHILPYVRFEGGDIELSGEAVAVLDRMA